jgi:hypothetical protein
MEVVVDLDGRHVAGQHPMRAHAVPGVRVEGAAHDGHFVHLLRLVRQVLADVDAGDVGLDRLELAAKLRGSVRLEVVHIDVARAAAQPQKDDRRVLGGFVLLFRPGLKPQVVGQGEPTEAKEAESKKTAAGQAVAGPVSRSENVEHDWPLAP